MNTQINNITPEFLSSIKLPSQSGKKLNYLIFMLDSADSPNHQCRFPIGTAMISAALKAAGRNLISINLNLASHPVEFLLETIRKKRIDVVMVGGLSGQYNLIYRYLRAIKTAFPEILTMVGGGIITADALSAMEALEYGDIGIIGEGEITNNNVAFALENDLSLSDVPNVVFRNKHGEWVQTERVHDIDNLDMLPFADYDGFDFYEMIMKRPIPNDYGIGLNQRPIDMALSRSCPFNCTFCFHSSGVKYRKRSLDNIFSEIHILKSKYDITHIIIQDEMFLDDVAYFKEFCERISQYNVKWSFATRCTQVKKEMLVLAKDCGCYSFGFGIEAGNDVVLKSMQKHITVQQIQKAIDISLEVGLPAKGALIFGDVEETWDTFSESVRFYHENPDFDLGLDMISVYPGSKLYQIACQRGLIKDKVQFLRDGCPWINMTRMTDREYWEMVDRVDILKRFTERKTRPRLLNAKMNAEPDGNITIIGECPHCGWKNTVYGVERCGIGGILYCTHCEREYVAVPIDYVDRDKFRQNIVSYISGKKVAIWAATYPITTYLLMLCPELYNDNVFLVERNPLIHNGEYMGKVLYSPNIISSENIEVVITPNSLGVQSKIRKNCQEEFPMVNRIIAIQDFVISSLC